MSYALLSPDPSTTLADSALGGAPSNHLRQCGHRGAGDPSMRWAMAWRTAGRLGLGGGPSILFSPLRFCEAAILEEGISNHCHEGVTVKAVPRSSLEVIETEFFLQLLMGLFANPAGLDGGCQAAQVRFYRQVGEIVFLLSGDALFADEPSLIPW